MDGTSSNTGLSGEVEKYKDASVEHALQDPLEMKSLPLASLASGQQASSSSSSSSSPESAQQESSSSSSSSELTESDEMSIMLNIFEIGLKHSTPKLLLSLMPNSSKVNSEHVKSHLQKRRNNRSRSREEFTDYYNKAMKANFKKWVDQKGDEAYGNPLDRSNKTTLHTPSINVSTLTHLLLVAGTGAITESIYLPLSISFSISYYYSYDS